MSLGLVPVAFTRVKEPPLVEAHRLGLRRLYEASPLGVVGALFAGVGTGAFWGLAPVMAAGIGLNPAGISGFMALSILGGALVMWPIGYLSDRLDRRKVLAWVCLFTGVAALGALWLISWDARLILAAGFLYGATAFSMYSLSAELETFGVFPSVPGSTKRDSPSSSTNQSCIGPQILNPSIMCGFSAS